MRKKAWKVFMLRLVAFSAALVSLNDFLTL